MMRVARHRRMDDNPTMHRQWASVEQSSTNLLSMISQGCNEAELVKELDVMTSDYLLEVVTHIAHDSNTVLHAAAVRERLGCLGAILRNKVDVNTRNGAGYSPLYLCLCHNSMRAAELLVKHGADVNETVFRLSGETLLHRMVKGDRTKAVELLIDNGASTNATTKQGETPLHYAARYNRPALALQIVRAGSDINAVNRASETALHIAIGSKCFDVAKILIKNQCSLAIKDSQGMTALHAAVAANALDLVRLMLTNNSTHINSKEMLLGRTPLLLACSHSTQKMAALLLSHGADANLTTNYRKSVLHVAAGNGNNGALGAVIKFTTNINALAINNKTALHLAVSERHRDVVRALLKAGVNVNLKDIDGNSALHMAAFNGDNTILSALLLNGAQVDALNMKQQTPLHVAFIEGNEETGWILIQAGSDTEILDIQQKKAFDYLQSKQDGASIEPTPRHSDHDTSKRSVRFDKSDGDEADEGQKKQDSEEATPLYKASAAKSALSEFLHPGAHVSLDSSTDQVATHYGAQSEMSDLNLDFSMLQVDESLVSSTPLGHYAHGKLKEDRALSLQPQTDDNEEDDHMLLALESNPRPQSPHNSEPDEFIDTKDNEVLSDEGHDTARRTSTKHRQRKSSKGSKAHRKLSKSKTNKGKTDESHGHHASHESHGRHDNHEHDHGHADHHEDHKCGQGAVRKRKIGLANLKH